MCEVKACDAWKPNDPASVTAVGDLVDCSFHPSASTCIVGIVDSP